MSADVLILNGAVLTQDPARPRAEAVALAGDRIVAVGRNRDIAKLKSRKTKVIDADGATVLPGFIEGHMHIFEGSVDLGLPNLEGQNGIAALAGVIRNYTAKHSGEGLLIAQQLSYVAMDEGRAATRQDLDKVSPERPLLAYAPDHHTAWANTRALELAGILGGRKLTPGHEIVMGPDGMATGELREPEAIAPVLLLTDVYKRPRLGLEGGEPEPYPTNREFESDLAIIKTGLAHLAQHGITSFHNMDGNIYTMQLLSTPEKRGELTARARVPFHLKPYMGDSALERARLMTLGYNSPWLQCGMVKMFMDGVLDSGTAVMLDDYPDRAGWRGDPLFSQEHFNRVATLADRLGLQIAVHAIGDGAVRMVLKGYQAARKANGARDSRHRVEHIEVHHPDDLKLFKSLDVIASMQTCHAPGCSGLPLEPTLTKIGRAKWPHAFAWATIRKKGIPLVFGTDWPVSDVNPMRAIHSAVTRKAWADDIPDQCQSLADTLASYTRLGAYAEFAEKQKGMLRKGYLADVVVLDRNIGEIAPDDLQHVKVRSTIAGGRLVYSA
jgi:predicted amidohydrolase YtcJ